MEVGFGPNSVDEPNIQYKLQRKIKVFNTTNPLQNRGYNLVTCASKYGIVFVASPDGNLTVYYLNDLLDKECEAHHMIVQLQEKPTHISVNCDNELLAVTGGQLLCIYKVVDFQNPNVAPTLKMRCDVNPSTFVSALQWNPCIPDTIAMAYYDGTLLVSQVSTSQIKKVPSKARCICWSPKGKQLVTGNNDGTLSQYKPDLTPAKTIPAPNLFENSPVEALAIYWIATFQFAVVYKNATDNSRPAVTIISTPKAGQPLCQNYEDICYSMGSDRPWYYYLQGLPQWNMIMSSSSNSMEIATLGSADGANWVQWCQTDEARPELPLTDKKQENYPVGVCVDTCATHQIQWDENTILPHMPLLHVVSHTGMLTIFNIINLNKQAAQLCTAPQQIMLPQAALTSEIPGEVPAAPAPAPAPVPVAPAPAPVIQQKPPSMQPVQLPPSLSQPQAAPAPQYNILNVPKPTFSQPQMTQGFVQAPVQAEKKPTPVEVKPTPAPQPAAPQAQPTPPKPTAAQIQETAALKAEQERLNEMKANQELKNMLVKEVNDFQMELYKFMVKTRETQARLQKDIDSLNANFNFNTQDAEQLKKECSLDELRGAIVQLKLELVRACAVVAEARTHAEAKDYHQWTQADPLTTKRVASVKKLAYYVQNQLEQAQKALDYKWNEAVSRDQHFSKPGQRMIRPILDDVYQPLVKQQEILSRQQAVLRTLRNTLNECDAPMFKSTSLLRSTPFRNKDPLSKLTKNILNMSLDTTDSRKKDALLSSQKLDALRDMLSNHKTVKIKPVNVEMRQHLATMRMNYEKSLKEKAQEPPQEVKMEPKIEQITEPVGHDIATPTAMPTQVEPEPFVQPETEINFEQIQEPAGLGVIMPTAMPTPVGGTKANVTGIHQIARTLFADTPKEEQRKPEPQSQVLPKPPALPSSFTPTTTQAPVDTRSVLKDLLQSKQNKNDANTFMGQSICSPSSFSSTATTKSTTSTPAPSAMYTAKPISDINNMFSKFTPQAFSQEPKLSFGSENKTTAFSPEVKSVFSSETKPAFAQEKSAFAPEKSAFAPEKSAFAPEKSTFAPETKPVSMSSTPKSSETGEPEAETKTFTLKPKPDKPMTNLFGMKTSTPIASSVPDVLKTTQEVKAPPKPVEKEKSKENVPEKVESKPTVKPTAEKKAALKPLKMPGENKPSVFETAQPVVSSSPPPAPSEPKSAEIKSDENESPKATDKAESPNSSASSIFAAANTSIPNVPKEEPTTPTTETPSKSDTSTEELTPTSEQSQLFATASTSPSAASIFSSAVASQPKPTSQATSIFASAASSAPTSVFGSTQGSIFSNKNPTATTATSIFGSSTQSAKPSVFSTPTPSSPTSSPSSVFGAAATTTAQSGSIFSSSSFSAATTTASSPTSVFGSSSASSVFASTATTQSSVFGTSTNTTASAFGTAAAPSQASIFGVASTPNVPASGAQNAQSIFASAASTNKPSAFGGSGNSVFGSTASTQSVFGATTTQASAFGASATTQSSVFGSSPATTQASLFGGTATTQSSVFGSPTPTTQASVFGTPTTQASVFGSQPTTTAQSGFFGGDAANLFASASISTTSAPSPTSGGSIFGGGGSGGSVFGSSNTNVFGGKTTFGQPNPTAAAIFGGGGATAFGQQQQKSAPSFWSGGNANADGGFGSSGFGQQPTTQASSIFGGTTGGSFSTPSTPGQAFGSPQSAAFGQGENKPSVFGSPQQSTPAFGGSPVFGSKPVFGQPSGFGSPPSGGGFGSSFGGGFNKSPSSGFGAPAAFGGAPTFGGAPAFGSTSPGKMFGGGAQPNFGTPTQSNATFENLATQNTLTFGNLAQQAQAPQQPAPSFNTSPSFTGWRG